MADDDDAFVRVRTLDGQSLIVALPAEKTVSDLRLLLLERGWPMLASSAGAARSFHLVHKGEKLAPSTQIRTLLLQEGEFIACIPYTRKQSANYQCSSATRKSGELVGEEVRPEFAFQNDLNVQTSNPEPDQSRTRKKRRLATNADSAAGFPPALQRMERVFTALNAVCGFLQKNRIELTWQTVKSALRHSCTHIEEVVIVKDIKDLATICPKVIVLTGIVGEGEDASFHIELLQSKTQGRGHLSDRGLEQLSARRQRAFEHAVNEVITYIKSKECTLSDITLEMVLSAAKEMFYQLPYSKTGHVSYARPVPRARAKPTPRRQQYRCLEVKELSTAEMVEHLKQHLGSFGQIVHCERLKARIAKYGQIQLELSDATKTALKRIGVTSLYTHQTAAVNAALTMKSTIVSTPTASGKSLCYNIPVLEELSRNTESCALYLFPTKALAQDQLRALQQLTTGLPQEIKMGVYDGDTYQTERHILRDGARLIISNPDMLHCSVLPSHKQFERFLSNLKYVVIDEAHAYRGAFGCHTAFIIRRLRRLCSHLYGTEITFIICSATVANPQEHAMELTGLREITSVKEDGSPCGEKMFLLWNPPLRSCESAIKDLQQETQMKRFSPILEVASLFAEMVQHGFRCITFCKTRKLCELVLSYTREILKETAPDLQETIRAYRAGYTPEERRSIEKNFFGGILRGVAATSALELGIDVGSLDATLHLGFPGTVASLWQQAGRAGRREKPSLSVYVAFESPLDQHFMKEPAKLFSRSIENAQLDVHNQQVCTRRKEEEEKLTLPDFAFEHPLHVVYDEDYFGTGLKPAILELVKKGYLGRHPSCSQIDSWNYIGEAKSPSLTFSIRAIDPEKYTIVNEATNKVIEEVEASKAFFEVYEGAIYINQGRKYLVKTLDLTERLAMCCPTDVRYYTKTRDFTDVYVVGSELVYPRRLPDVKYPVTSAQANKCKVTTRWIGFRRIWEGTNETFDSVDLNLPDVSYESQAAWIRVPHQVREHVEAKSLDLRAGLHAASHALLNVLPLYIMCNPSDLGTECANPQDKRYYPMRLLVFDRCAGGIGISAQAQLLFAELLQAALEQVKSCECSLSTGCPNCIQYLSCGEYNEVLDKAAAILILQGVIESEDALRVQGHPDIIILD